MGAEGTRTARNARWLLGAVVAVAGIGLALSLWGDGTEAPVAPGTDEEQASGAAESTSEVESEEADTSVDAPKEERPTPPASDDTDNDDTDNDEAADPAGGEADLEPVPVEPLTVSDPIELDDTGDFGTGLTVRLVDIESVDGEATARFEVAGPALRVLIELTNESDEEISLATTQVDVSYGEDRTPGMALSGPDVEAFPSSLAAGEGAMAAVVFGVPLDERERVQILVTHDTASPIIVFEGAVS